MSSSIPLPINKKWRRLLLEQAQQYELEIDHLRNELKEARQTSHRQVRESKRLHRQLLAEVSESRERSSLNELKAHPTPEPPHKKITWIIESHNIEEKEALNQACIRLNKLQVQYNQAKKDNAKLMREQKVAQAEQQQVQHRYVRLKRLYKRLWDYSRPWFRLLNYMFSSSSSSTNMMTSTSASSSRPSLSFSIKDLFIDDA